MFNTRLAKSVIGTQVRSDLPLTNDQMYEVAPSIFTLDRAEERSERYTQIPTIQVVEALRNEGFEPFMVAQTKPRNAGRTNYARHMIRMRHASQINGSEANEIILLNSHDATSSYQMLAGVFRAVCQNSCVAGDVVQDVRVRHSGDVIGQVIEGSYEILKDFDKLDSVREEWSHTLLSRDEQYAYGKAALELKFEPGMFPTEQVIMARRYEDQDIDLWTVFNKVQENLIRGGMRGFNQEKKRRVTTRGVKGLQENVKLNRALWTLTEEMAALKA